MWPGLQPLPTRRASPQAGHSAPWTEPQALDRGGEAKGQRTPVGSVSLAHPQHDSQCASELGGSETPSHLINSAP